MRPSLIAKIALGAIAVLLVLCLSACAQQFPDPIKPVQLTVFDTGTTYSRYEGSYTYVDLVDKNGRRYVLHKVDLDSFPIGSKLETFITND